MNLPVCNYQQSDDDHDFERKQKWFEPSAKVADECLPVDAPICVIADNSRLGKREVYERAYKKHEDSNLSDRMHFTRAESGRKKIVYRKSIILRKVNHRHEGR